MTSIPISLAPKHIFIMLHLLRRFFDLDLVFFTPASVMFLDISQTLNSYTTCLMTSMPPLRSITAEPYAHSHLLGAAFTHFRSGNLLSTCYLVVSTALTAQVLGWTAGLLKEGKPLCATSIKTAWETVVTRKIYPALSFGTLSFFFDLSSPVWIYMHRVGNQL